MSSKDKSLFHTSVQNLSPNVLQIHVSFVASKLLIFPAKPLQLTRCIFLQAWKTAVYTVSFKLLLFVLTLQIFGWFEYGDSFNLATLDQQHEPHLQLTCLHLQTKKEKRSIFFLSLALRRQSQLELQNFEEEIQDWLLERVWGLRLNEGILPQF